MNRTVNAVLFGFTLLVLSTCLLASTSHAEAPPYGMPSTINPSANYLFFFHNQYVETKGPDEEYDDILQAFADRRFIVISEKRPKDSSVIEYAKKASANIQKLLDAGVPHGKITVAGHSKGGVIALQVSSLMLKPKINYIIMAGCGINSFEKTYPDFSRLKGNFLSVYATSDKVAGSCSSVFSQAKQDISSKEIALEDAAGHQLFFTVTDVWFEPVISWLGVKM